MEQKPLRKWLIFTQAQCLLHTVIFAFRALEQAGIPIMSVMIFRLLFFVYTLSLLPGPFINLTALIFAAVESSEHRVPKRGLALAFLSVLSMTAYGIMYYIMFQNWMSV